MRPAVWSTNLLIFAAPDVAETQASPLASLAAPAGLRVQRFDIDGAHSAVEFSVRFMGLTNVRGAFADFGGTVLYDGADVTRSAVSVVIRTASINTNHAQRDKDLR